MTTTQRQRPTEASTSATDARRAVDAFVAVLDEQLPLVAPAAHVGDLGALHEAAAAVLDAVRQVTRPSLYADVARAVGAFLRDYESHLANPRWEAVNARWAAYVHRPVLLQAFDRALAGGDEDITGVEQEIAATEAALADARGDLDAAVLSADIHAVLALRTKIEVDLPTQLDELRAHRLGLLVEEAEALGDVPRRRAEEAGALLEATRADMAAAHEHYVTVTAAAGVAERAAQVSREMAATAGGRTHELRREHAAALAQLEGARERRFRRFAGVDA